MKIAFCVLKNLDFAGGIEKYTLELGSRLVRRGHEICVYSMRHYGPVSERVEGMRVIPVHSVPLRPLEKLTASASAALQALTDDKIDIVHFHHVAAGWMGWLPKLRGRRCVLQSHGLAWRTPQWGRSGSTFLRLLERMAVRGCDVFTGSSLTQNEYYSRKYGIEAIYIPSGADVREPVRAQEILRMGLHPRSYILYVGRLSEEKGVHFLISAFRRLTTECKLVLVGPACSRRYRDELNRLARGDGRIVFTGSLRGRALAELYSNALLYVQPSQLEGLSLALLEAMGYGNCCLVSDIPENLEAIGEAGWSFRSGDVGSLEEKLAWLIDHPFDALGTGELARARVSACYSWDRITTQFEALYTHLLSRRPAA